MSDAKGDVLKKRGGLGSLSELMLLFTEYPTAPFFIQLRNFNELTRITLFGLFIESRNNRGRAYRHGDGIINFLPEEIISEITKKQRGDGYIPFQAFMEIGQRLADLMGRNITLVHQYGSGDQIMASYDDYEFLTTKNGENDEKVAKLD